MRQEYMQITWHELLPPIVQMHKCDGRHYTK